MAKNFRELRSRMSDGARATSEVERRRLEEEMSLYQLRKARERTQTKLAEELHMGQGDVSKLERRTDMYVSTLASYLRLCGRPHNCRVVGESRPGTGSPRRRQPTQVRHRPATNVALDKWKRNGMDSAFSGPRAQPQCVIE